MPGTYRKYQVNESFFDSIDTEAQAYWLGFLTADASLAINHIRLMLKGSDAGHLEKFKKDLGSTHRVVVKEFRTKPGYHYASLQVGSQRLVQSLAKLGVGEKKSLVVEPCKEVPAELARHYWRGLVDGDGSLSLKPNSGCKKQWTVQLLGSKGIVTGFWRYMRSVVYSKASVKASRNIWVVAYSGNRITYPIVSALYAGATVYLDRKKALADQILGEV